MCPPTPDLLPHSFSPLLPSPHPRLLTVHQPCSGAGGPAVSTKGRAQHPGRFPSRGETDHGRSKPQSWQLCRRWSGPRENKAGGRGDRRGAAQAGRGLPESKYWRTKDGVDWQTTGGEDTPGEIAAAQRSRGTSASEIAWGEWGGDSWSRTGGQRGLAGIWLFLGVRSPGLEDRRRPLNHISQGHLAAGDAGRSVDAGQPGGPGAGS